MQSKQKPKTKSQAKKAKPKTATKPKPTAEQIANRADRKTNALKGRADVLARWISVHNDAIAALQNKVKSQAEKYEKLVVEHNKLIDQYDAMKKSVGYNFSIDDRNKLSELARTVESLRTSPRGNHATAKELADLHAIVREHAEKTQAVLDAVQQQIRNVVDVRNSVGGGI